MKMQRIRTSLSAIGLLALLVTAGVCQAIAPMADLDRSFGSGAGSMFAAYDVPGSTLADRGVAVFADRATTGYVMIGEAASPTAGKTRIAFSFVTAAGLASSSVKTFDVLRVDAACQRPTGAGFVVGVVEGTTSENASVLYAFDGAGNLDTSVFGGDGKIGADLVGPEWVVNLVCSATDVLVNRGFIVSGINAPGGRIFRAEFADSVTGGNSFVPVEGGYWDPVGMGRVSSQRVPAVFAYKDNLVDNTIRITTYDDGTLGGSSTSTYDIPFSTCGAMSDAVAGRAMIAQTVGNAVLVAGRAESATFPTTNYVWLLEFNVPATGAPTLGSCTSRVVGSNNSVVGTNFYMSGLAVSADGTEAYLLGSGYRVDPISQDYDFELYRFTKSGNSWATLAGDQISLEFPHGNLVPEADDRGATGYIDARTTPNRLMVAGTRQWLDADTDASLTRLQLAPMFADSFD